MLRFWIFIRMKKLNKWELKNNLGMKDLKKMYVSYQENFWGKIINRPLYDVLYEIKSTKHESITLQLRQHYLTEDGLYGLKKKKLPVATFCANFKESLRTKEGLNQYNCVMIIDIDHVGNHAINQLFEKLSQDKYLFGLWISPSGNGIKGLIKINYEADFSSNEVDIWHYTAFAQIAFYFKEKYNIDLDASGKDFTRLCFISHDSNIIIKHMNDIDLFTVKLEDRIEIHKQVNTNKVQMQKISISKKQLNNLLANPQGKNNPSDKRTIQNIIKYLKNNNKSITYEYDNWLRVGLAIASSFTYELGIKHFNDLSSFDKTKYDEKNCEKMLKDCYINNKRFIKFSTIIHLACEKGFINNKILD